MKFDIPKDWFMSRAFDDEGEIGAGGPCFEAAADTFAVERAKELGLCVDGIVPGAVSPITVAAAFDFVCKLGQRHTPEATANGAFELAKFAKGYGLTPTAESFTALGHTYFNLVFGDLTRATTLITAHYDTTGFGGACDNGSGLAVALSLAAAGRTDLAVVLTACEEPPFFSHCMGAEVLSEMHQELANVRWLALDSLGWITGEPDLDRDRQLLLHAPESWPELTPDWDLAQADPCAWVDGLTDDLNQHLKAQADRANRVRMLSEVRQTLYPAVLVLDTNTTSIPFHTRADAPERVDVAWLAKVAAALDATL